MDFLKVEVDGEVLIVKLARGKANALNAAMVEELITVFADAAGRADVRAAVLASDRPKFFSTGFDVIEVFDYDQRTMTEFFGRFIDLYESMLRLPKPLIAAVNGHAYAGGAVLALSCDARVMAEGAFGFAVNEIKLGIVVPPGFIPMATNAVGFNNARELILTGKTLTPAQAFDIGLACEMATPDDVLERAIVRAREMAGEPPGAFAAVKRLFLDRAGFTGVSDRASLDRFIEHWFSPEAMERKEALIKSMR
jgi:Delta3-Delta2-enoyl-CoA isomerase